MAKRRTWWGNPALRQAIALTEGVGWPELVSNGTFSTDTSGWVQQANTTLSVVNGRMRVLNVGTNYGIASYTLSDLTVGAVYRVGVDCYLGVDIDMPFRIDVTTVAAPVATPTGLKNNRTEGRFTADVTATAATMYLHLGNRNDPDSYNEFDNVSVKRR